ncbi:hypothetical protein DEM27_24700 [Metarhizobium album]|uniref:Uncharacterized protein n=1 Tax=Metarhizobium album TaxID=2182425 RepID=A0A2U2DKB2_9HYPH|nr:hypothetical protein [Rhizobium album]PWE53738.1 hypothetical protein DEM27_24700 [Rhizobium album]
MVDRDLTTRGNGRSPHDLFVGCLWALAFIGPITFAPYISVLNWISLGSFAALLFMIFVLLALLSDVWGIMPAFITRLEANHRNRHAHEAYDIPVRFAVAPIRLLGFSRLTAIRTDTGQELGLWALKSKRKGNEHERRA